MANISEKAISILAENSNSGVSYLITTVHKIEILYQKGSNPISFLRQAAEFFSYSAVHFLIQNHSTTCRVKP